MRASWRTDLTGMLRHILLVDGDAQRRDALASLPHAHRWAITRAEDGAQAILELERQPHDVAIADVTAVVPNGTALLHTVRERWPSTTLIALCDTTDPAGLQYQMLAPATHQYLRRNASAGEIMQLIERSLGLQDLLLQPALRSLIGGIQHLPPRPRIFARLQVMMRHERATPRKIGLLLEEDAAIAAKALQLANCVVFRDEDRIRNIEQAIIRLGFSGLSNLVMSAEVLVGWSRVACRDLDLDSMQAHVQQVAKVTAALLRGSPWHDEAVLAALLHDIGYWVLAHERPADLDRATLLARKEDIPIHEAERRVLGTCHAELGAYLLGLWGMPHGLVEAVAYHHIPERAHASQFNSLSALVVALALAGTDDTDAFHSLPRRNGMVSPDYLDQLENCPFDWSDAARIAASCLPGPEHRQP